MNRTHFYGKLLTNRITMAFHPSFIVHQATTSSKAGRSTSPPDYNPTTYPEPWPKRSQTVGQFTSPNASLSGLSPLVCKLKDTYPNGHVKSDGATSHLSYFEKVHLGSHQRLCTTAIKRTQSGQNLFAPFLAEKEEKQANVYICY